jgi:acetyltransferase
MRILALDGSRSSERASEQPTRPYPSQYVAAWKMKDGTTVQLRPIRPEDEPLMVKFHATLSERTVYLRYFHMENLGARVAHERLLQKCFIDYDREMALVADLQDSETREHAILAVGRLTKTPDEPEAELAVLVADRWQNQGLGTELVRRLIEIARDEKLARVLANILPENQSMRSLADRLGFTVRPTDDPSVLTAVLTL